MHVLASIPRRTPTPLPACDRSVIADRLLGPVGRRAIGRAARTTCGIGYRTVILWPVVFCLLLTLLNTTSLAQEHGTAQVGQLSALNGMVEGSIQILRSDSFALNGGAEVLGDLLVPGSPDVRLNGRPEYEGTLDGEGSVGPVGYRITLNGRAKLRHVVRRIDPVVLVPVPASPPPSGTRTVTVNRARDTVGDFGTLRHLTLNGPASDVLVPPGSYGQFTANGGSAFVLGKEDVTEPQVYHFERLLLNGNASLRVAGPVVITVGQGVMLNGSAGNQDDPNWLHLRLINGPVTLNGRASIHGFVNAPASTVTLNSSSRLIGGLTADRLVLNGGARLVLLPPDEGDPDQPPVSDADHDGMDDNWERTHGLDPNVDDSEGDPDGDGVPNLEEFQRGLHPVEADTDGDDLYDGDELELGLDPTLPSPDPEPPTVPDELVAAVTTGGGVLIAWKPSADNLRVAGYIVYRDGEPMDTEDVIRTTSFTDVDVLPGDEIGYQVRAFDFAGNLSELSSVQLIEIPARDEDADQLPDEWEYRYFEGEDADASADPDEDGLTTLEEYETATDPQDFYNGIKPRLENLSQEELQDPNQLATRVLKPDGVPWPHAPITFNVDKGRRRIAATEGGPHYQFRVKVRAGADGVARVYLEPIAP